VTPYTSQMVNRAREHVEAGWSLRETEKLLLKEFGRAPTSSTIHTWTNPGTYERARDSYRPRERSRKVQRVPSKPRRTTPERAVDRMREMYLRGLSLRAIGQVTAVFFGEELTEAQVKSRLGLRSGEVAARRSG
jgi:hypothetical protein